MFQKYFNKLKKIKNDDLFFNHVCDIKADIFRNFRKQIQKKCFQAIKSNFNNSNNLIIDFSNFSDFELYFFQVSRVKLEKDKVQYYVRINDECKWFVVDSDDDEEEEEETEEEGFR